MPRKSGDDKPVPFGGGGYNDPDYRIKREGCKLCASQLCDQAEKEYDRRGNVSAVLRFLRNEGEDISYNAVRNHLLYHYVSVVNNSLVREYAGEIDQWQSLQHDQRTALRRTMATLEREMHYLAAQNEDLSISERRKNTDTINKLASTLLQYRGKLEDLETEQEPIRVVFNNLQVIMEEEIRSANTNEAKRVMSNVIDRLKDSCGDLVVETGG